MYTFDTFTWPTTTQDIKWNRTHSEGNSYLYLCILHISGLGQCRIPTAWWVWPVPRERRMADSRWCGCTSTFPKVSPHGNNMKREAMKAASRRVPCWHVGHELWMLHLASPYFAVLRYVISLFEYGLTYSTGTGAFVPRAGRPTGRVMALRASGHPWWAIKSILILPCGNELLASAVRQ